MKHLVSALIAIVLASPALAEWDLTPQGGWVSDLPTARGIAESGVHVLSITCRDGTPFLFTLGFPAKGGANRQEGFAVEVDGQRFSQTGLHVPADGLWTSDPGTDLIDALKAGSVARILPPGQSPQIVRLRGSSRAISGALAQCGPPTGERAAADATPTGRIVQFGQLIATTCGGPYDLAEGAEMTGDLDGDGRDDVVLNWAGVSCADPSKGRGAGFCGAALCRIEVLLSKPPNVQQVMGHNPRLVPGASGSLALRTTTMGRTCGDAAQTCDIDWRFNGKELEAVR